MNIFNRVIMIIAMLCVAVFSIVIIVNIFMDFLEWSVVYNSIINYTTNLNIYIFATVIFLVFAIALIILVFEFYRKKIKLATLSTDFSGKTVVSLKAASNQIMENLYKFGDMTDLKVNVIPEQDGIIINTYSKLIKGVNVGYKTKEIREIASSFASNNLGLKVLQSNYTVVGFVNEKVKTVVEKGIITINKIGLSGSGQAIFKLSGPGGPHTPITLNYGERGKWENLPLGSYTIIESWPDGNVYNYSTQLSASAEEINTNNKNPIIEVLNLDKVSVDTQDGINAQKKDCR